MIVPNLTGFPSEPLCDLPHRAVLQIAGAERADDARQYPRFELVVQDRPARR